MFKTRYTLWLWTSWLPGAECSALVVLSQRAACQREQSCMGTAYRPDWRQGRQAELCRITGSVPVTVLYRRPGGLIDNVGQYDSASSGVTECVLVLSISMELMIQGRVPRSASVHTEYYYVPRTARLEQQNHAAKRLGTIYCGGEPDQTINGDESPGTSGRSGIRLPFPIRMSTASPRRLPQAPPAAGPHSFHQPNKLSGGPSRHPTSAQELRISGSTAYVPGIPLLLCFSCSSFSLVHTAPWV